MSQGRTHPALTVHRTRSEELVEEFCARHSIAWRPIKRAPNGQRPDYAIKIEGMWCILEVKQIEPTDTDNDLVGNLRWIDAGKRLKGPFRSAKHQLRKFSSWGLPTVICLYDMTVSFHDESFHIRKAFRPNENADVSAIAVLRQPMASEVIIDLYHNSFANVPIDPCLAAPFVRRQEFLDIDLLEQRRKRMVGTATRAIINCPVCSAQVEVYPPGPPGQARIGWRVRDSGLCKTPPLGDCPTMRTEIEQRFPGHLPSGLAGPS